MKRTTRMWTSYIVILALLFTVIPISGLGGITKAADNPIVISNPMGTQSNPTQVSTSKINVSGNFYGITDLKYTVTQMRKLSTGELVAVQTREGVEKPYITGSTFTFNNVELFEGLNEITVSGKDTSGSSAPSERVYVEYSKLPIILSVNYNQQNLKENNIISDKLFNDELLIKGEVNNAERIVAKVNGNETEYIGSVLPNNTYIIANLPLQRGKNTIEIIASNNTKVYPVRLEIIYNDGNPYIGDAILDSNGVPVELESTTNITTNDVRITGSLNEFELNDVLEIKFNTLSFSMNFTEFDSTAVGQIVKSGTGYTLTKTGASSFELYFNGITPNTINTLMFTFTRGLNKFNQTFYLNHFDPTLNYITQTSGLSDSTTNKKLTFYIFTKENTVSVNHRLPNDAGSGTILTPVSQTQQADGNWMHKFETDLQPGYNTIFVRPNNNDINMKTYRVLYINSPDVKVTNLVNGDRVGNTGQESKLVGELVNIDLSADPTLDDRFKTKLTIKNREGSVTYLLKAENFIDVANPFIFTFDLEGKLKTGANEIIIEVTDGITTTTTHMTVFYFSGDGPEANLNIDEERKINSDDMFVPSKTSGLYETEARYVHFNGSYNEYVTELIFYLNGTRVIQETVQTTGTKTSVGTDPISGENVRITIDWINKTFQTDYPITLQEGSNVFEIEAVSATGTSWNEKIYLNRYMSPVKLIKPNLNREKVVNSNFIEVEIQVDSADKVTVGKTEATYQKLTNDELRSLIDSLGLVGKYDKDGNGLSESELSMIDQTEVTGQRYVTDVFLKAGKNVIKYEVEKNGEKSKYEFEIYYANSPEEGARFKTEYKDKIQVFDKKVQLKFPKNTWLVKPNQLTPTFDQYVSDSYLEFGIVDKTSGKLVKVWDETNDVYVLEEFEEPFKTIMPVRIIPPDRTGYAGQIYWIEADGDLTKVDSGLVPTNRGELTLKYDQSIVNDSQNILAIYHFDPAKQKWINLGGVVDAKAKTITTSITEFGYYTVMAKRGTYNDIFEHTWAANYLQTMYAKGIMMPESYNRFGSDLLTSRGEFATILVKSLDIPINAGPYVDGNKMYPVNPTFVDVVPLLDPVNGFYSYEYIETAGRAGIIRGLGQGEFAPDGLLTREQAAMMIARAANYKIESDPAKAKDQLRKYYDDVDKINDYAAGYVLAVTKAKVMSGSDVNGVSLFNPRSYLSRAETSAIAYRLMQSQKLLPK